jgi:hypothetical protein
MFLQEHNVITVKAVRLCHDSKILENKVAK